MIERLRCSVLVDQTEISEFEELKQPYEKAITG